jgi:hypothetical protein
MTTLLTRPKLSLFKLDEKTGLYRLRSYAGYSWYLIERGTIKQGKDRLIVWGREEETTYIVCPICRAISTLDTSAMIINRRDLDSNLCVVCSSCKSHFWCSLIGWVEKETGRFMKRNPETCPFCKKHVIPRGYEVTHFMRETYFYRYFYCCCGFYWPKRLHWRRES